MYMEIVVKTMDKSTALKNMQPKYKLLRHTYIKKCADTQHADAIGSIVFSHSHKERLERFIIKRNQGIEIASLSVDRFI